MVRDRGLEPLTPSVSRKCSTTELTAQAAKAGAYSRKTVRLGKCRFLKVRFRARLGTATVVGQPTRLAQSCKRIRLQNSPGGSPGGIWQARSPAHYDLVRRLAAMWSCVRRLRSP